MNHDADILLVTVTDVESRAVLEVFRAATGIDPKPLPVGDRLYFDLGDVSGARVALALSSMGTGGVHGSQEVVRGGIESLSPSAVIMVGVAFGINEEKQAIGDILVSERLMLYDLQRVGTDGSGNIRLLARGDRPHASSWLLNRFQVSNLQREASVPAVRFGPILSGDKLADNIDFRRQLLQFEPEAIGGEMEGAGVYVACQNSKVDWIVVKSICDWADGLKSQNKSERQQLAAANAAAFVRFALQQAPLIRSHQFYPRRARFLAPEPPHQRVDTVRSSLPSQAYFFGRETELRTIAEAISPDARTWGVLIDGPGGIGKTALAVRAAHVVPAAHFSHKLFLSAKVRELTPTGEQVLEDFMLPNYMMLLTELGRELGDENTGHVDPSQRANAVRRLLGDVRALIVIDNVETFPESERVRLYQFLARLPATCKAIVTSRRRSDIDARVIRLDRLPQQDALDLLAELAHSNARLRNVGQQQLVDLYELTNGNPLIIKWVAGQLGRSGSHYRNIEDACAFLKGIPLASSNDPLEYVFGDLLDTFTDSETAVLSALALFTQPASLQWVADIAGLTASVTLTALEDLTDRALLLTDDELSSFVLPPLAATFLRRKRPEALIDAGGRLTNCAYAFAMENGWHRYERFASLEAQWSTIAAALPLYTQGHDNRLQSLCSALYTFLHYSGRWDEGLKISEEAERRALHVADLYSAGRRAFDAGWIYQARGRTDDVLACATRAAANWAQSPQAGTWEKAAATHLRGLGLKLAKDYASAAAACQEALQLWQTITPESDDTSIALNSLAGIEHVQGDYASAERHYSEALRIARKVDEPSSIALYMGNLAELALDRESWESAELMAREALSLAEKVGRQELVGVISRYVASALARQGRTQEGRPYAHRACEIATRLNQYDDLAKARAVLFECDG